MVLVIFNSMRYFAIVILLFGCAGQAQTVDRSTTDLAVESNLERDKDGIFFSGEYKEVLARAKREEKQVLLHFGADWCLPCKQMKKNTYTNSIVKTKLVKEYLPFEIDVDYFWGMDIAEAFEVTKYPTIIILNSKGKQISKHEGYLGPREMYRLLRNY